MILTAAAKKKESTSNVILKDMTLGEVITKHPKTGQVFMNYGLHCIGCHISPYESVEQGAAAHGITGSKFSKMMKDLNEAAGKK